MMLGVRHNGLTSSYGTSDCGKIRTDLLMHPVLLLVVEHTGLISSSSGTSAFVIAQRKQRGMRLRWSVP